MRSLRRIALALVAVVPLFGELGLEQKEHDFRNLAALYAKRYAPATWKKQLLGVDILELGPWMERVRASKSDLEFLEICTQFVGSFQDAHSAFFTTSNFSADSGLFVDIYEGKVLVQAVDPFLLPPSRYPIRVGDELLAIDGNPISQLLDEYAKLRGNGNPLSARRYAADLLVFRRQQLVPRAAELPEESTFQFLHQTGAVASYTIAWEKFGIPLTEIGPAPSPEFTSKSVRARARAAEAAAESVPAYLLPLLESQNWAAPEGYSSRAARAERLTADERGYVTGVGSCTPAFAIPANFTIRRGLSSADFHFSATYEAGGKRIGYLRVPSFSPPSTVVTELAAEIAFFQQNTDGLVVDVMRNPGGGCYLQILASYLIPRPFTLFSESIRVTMDRIISYSNALETAKLSGAEQWIINYYRLYLDMLRQSYVEGRGMTGPIPACLITQENQPARSANGAVLAYTKPLIVLIDEFSISAADIFAGVMQDNKRGPLVGTRTSGAGGSVSSYPAGFYSEVTASNTNTLVLRKEPGFAPGYPSVPYIENLGVHADVYLDFMTRDNLLQRGRPFVLDFTGAIVREILRVEAQGQ